MVQGKLKEIKYSGYYELSIRYKFIDKNQFEMLYESEGVLRAPEQDLLFVGLLIYFQLFNHFFFTEN